MKIVYRVVNIILGVLTFVSAFFVGFIKVSISTTEKLADIFKAFSSDNASGMAVAEQFSIHRMINLFTGKDDLSFILGDNKGPILWPRVLAPINTRLAVVAGAFVLMLVVALFVIIFSCISNKKWPTLVAGVVGIVSDIVMMNAFRSAAREIYDGTVNLSGYIVDQIIGNGLFAVLIGSAANSALQLNFSLCGLQNAFLFIFIAMTAWAAIYYLVDLGDPEAAGEKAAEKAAKEAKKKAKAEKKAAKAQAK